MDGINDQLSSMIRVVNSVLSPAQMEHLAQLEALEKAYKPTKGKLSKALAQIYK